MTFGEQSSGGNMRMIGIEWRLHSWFLGSPLRFLDVSHVNAARRLHQPNGEMLCCHLLEWLPELCGNRDIHSLVRQGNIGCNLEPRHLLFNLLVAMNGAKAGF